MIAQRDSCHVVTVASGAAITVYPGYGAYSGAKHGALALTEALYLDLGAEGIDNIGVTIAMPGKAYQALALRRVEEPYQGAFDCRRSSSASE